MMITQDVTRQQPVNKRDVDDLKGNALLHRKIG